MTTGNTAAYRILEFLTRNRGQGFTNAQIGMALALPSDSVRRVMGGLARAMKVIPNVPGGRVWQIAN